MMGSVSPETCPASYIYGIINFDTLLDAVSVQQPHIQQPYTYAKPGAASAVLGS